MKKWDEGLQIIHCHRCHWVVAHKEAVSTDIEKVYDTFYDNADDVIKTVLLNLFVFSSHGPTMQICVYLFVTPWLHSRIQMLRS